MRILLIGGGGREHALAWKIAQSPSVEALFAAPGNPGIARHAVCVPLAADALDGLLAFARRERIDLTVVGPEAPLVAGLADRFAEAGLAVFGPVAQAAAIEGSKAFAKGLMERHEIPTARFATFAAAAPARRYCRERGAPLVIKADGLAGGMGAHSPVASFDAAMERRVMETIVRPTIAALAKVGAPYRGVLYVGLMLTAEGPKVLEFNCRFGDPECQALLVRAPGDLVPLLVAAAHGGSWPEVGGWPALASVCVVLASGGYPGKYRTGVTIDGVEAAEARPGVRVFHAGTALRDGRLVTEGGRVLGVTAVGDDLATAIARAYGAIGEIRFEGMHYRSDMGRRRSA